MFTSVNHCFKDVKFKDVKFANLEFRQISYVQCVFIFHPYKVHTTLYIRTRILLNRKE